MPPKYLAHGPVTRVARARVPSGARELTDLDLGALQVLAMLGSRLDPLEALDAASGWAGGAVVAYRDGGRVCVRARLVGDDRGATDRLRSALARWAAAGPAGAARVGSDGGEVVLEACESRGELRQRPRRTGGSDAVALAAARLDAAAAIARDGLSLRRAYAAADCLAHVDPGRLANVRGSASTPEQLAAWYDCERAHDLLGA